ncbi:TPA_asm: L [Rose alphacytorhabdovirus 1]|nr:TPA_asm: L [Rose alphacytorhabdovirus 1]
MSIFFDDCDDDGGEGVEVYATVLPDYHLRNPLKMPTWLENRNIPYRQRQDKDYVTYYHPGASFGRPSDLNRRISALIPSQSLKSMETAIGDLYIRLKVDNSLLPPECQLDLALVLDKAGSVDRRYWDGMRFWNRVLLTMNAISSKRLPPSGVSYNDGVARIGMLDASMTILRTCVAITKGKKTELFDGDWVRMASDINTQRFLVLLSCNIGSTVMPDQYPDIVIVMRIFSWGDDVLEDLGNSGFKLLKAYEAIVIGYLQTLGEDGLVESDRFLNNTLRDLLDDDPKFYTYAKRLIDILSEVQNFHIITQIYGLHRVWGHPTVDSAKGMDKLRLIGKKNIIKSAELSVDAGRMFKVLFSREYLKKHGKFPKIMEGMSLLETKILENDTSALSPGIHSLEEWDRVRFQQTFDLPESFNLSMIIADKAISPTKSELIQAIKNRNTVMDPDKRRGVKRWLEDVTLKPKEFLREVNDGLFPDDHKIIGLTPKERELNPVPRMFSLMSHQMRVYVVVTEQMLSDHILKMFPQITMTDTLLDLTKKMYSTVKGQSSRVKRYNKSGSWASRVICMSLDFEKWNGHMRKEMTSGVFSAIGRLFGLPELFNNTYDIFESSYYYLADGSYVPNHRGGRLIVEEPYSFTGHRGGMEGLRQKGWTLYTVCCLEVILSKYDCTYKIMGMGDNQVLQITVYTKKVDHLGSPTDSGLRDMKKIITSIFDDLVESFTNAGLPLKPLETWMSEDLYLYGKVPLWRGVPLSMDVKKLMRTFPMSNEDIMTVENALGTISSNASAATQASSCVWSAYIVSIIMASICVNDFSEYHPLLGKGLASRAAEEDEWVLALDKDEVYRYPITGDMAKGRKMCLLMQMIPKSLGGYNGMNLYEMLMRGFPDNASRDICYIQNVINSSVTPNWMKDYLKCWITPTYMPRINYSTLLEDVTALNFLSPRSPTSGIRQLVANYMSTGVNISNEEFRDLMSSKYKNMSDYLSECLCEPSELHIRLFHDIYEATIFGYVDGILSKVVKTSTIQKLAIGDSKGAVFKSIERDEVTYYNYFRWRSSQVGNGYSDMCPTERCKLMRSEGWAKELRGVTTPFPASYISKSKCGAGNQCDCTDGYMSIHFPDGQLSNDSWNFDIGGNPPYLGSTTKEKVIIGAGGRIYSGEPLVRRPINLLKTINWFVPPDSNTAEVIRRCVTAVTDLNPEPYQGVSEGTAGSEVHRYRDSSTSHGALTSSNFLLSTRYHISTDNFTRYSKGSENTDIHYQALFCYIVELSNMMISRCIRRGDPVRRFDHFRQHCYKCINPIPEDFVDLVSVKALDAIPSRKANPYLFVPHEKIRVLERISPLAELSDRKLTLRQYQNIKPKAKMRWLQDIVCDRIVADIMGGKGAESHVTTGLLDVKSFERTMYLKFSPRYFVRRLIRQLFVAARWTCVRGKGYVKEVNHVDLIRSYVNMLSSAEEHSYLGAAMFYCWDETSKKINVYPEMISPSSNPISISSACSAMKKNLISLGMSRDWTMPNRCCIVTEDEKYAPVVYKMILSDWIRDNSDCRDCHLECDMMEQKNLEWAIKTAVCRSGHIIKDRMVRYPWVRSGVTVERLRKDGESEGSLDYRSVLSIPTLQGSFIIDLLSEYEVNIRPTVVGVRHGSTEYDFDRPSSVIKYSLFTLKSLPTATWYKWVDLLSPLRGLMKGKAVFCIGDGLGSSSRIVASLGVSKVLVSTLLNPDDAIPQTYVHNVSPMSIEIRSDVCDDSSMITKVNDILDSSWSRSWVEASAECSILISDIEMIRPDAYVERQQAFNRAVFLKDWDLVVFKDYLFSPNELCNRIGSLYGTCTGWKLRTSKMRSSFYPEVWWVITGVKPERMKKDEEKLCIDHRKIVNQWAYIKENLEDRYKNERITERALTLIQMMTPSDGGVKMMTHVREWMTFPIVGCMLPTNGAFTSLFLYLKKSKRPAYVKIQNESDHLKLYDSDYYRLRDRMFTLAVSMIADQEARYQLFDSSEYWHLIWYEKSRNSFWCKLVKSKDKDRRVDSIDYLPVLSCIMRDQNLLFEEFGGVIAFSAAQRQRKKAYFPISKNASLT